jgi:hypothetical protein
MNQKIKYGKRTAPRGATTHASWPGADGDDLTDRRCQYCGNRLAIVEADLYGRTCGYCEFKRRQVFDPDV